MFKVLTLRLRFLTDVTIVLLLRATKQTVIMRMTPIKAKPKRAGNKTLSSVL